MFAIQVPRSRARECWDGRGRASPTPRSASSWRSSSRSRSARGGPGGRPRLLVHRVLGRGPRRERLPRLRGADLQLPQGVVGFAVATAAFPALAESWQSARYADVRSELDRGLGLATFLGAPAAAGLLVLARPIVTVLYGYGKFGDEACQQTARVSRCSPLDPVPDRGAAPRAHLLRRRQHQDSERGVREFGGVRRGWRLRDGEMVGVSGIAAATTITAILDCCILGILLRRFPLPGSRGFSWHLAKILAASAICGIAAFERARGLSRRPSADRRGGGCSPSKSSVRSPPAQAPSASRRGRSASPSSPISCARRAAA